MVRDWGGGWGVGYGREMHVGEMVAVLVGQARREGQQEVTCSISCQPSCLLEDAG